MTDLPIKPEAPKAKVPEKKVEVKKPEDKAVEAARISVEGKAERLAEKNVAAKRVLDKLGLLKKTGKITPEQHEEFLKILMRLKPECWQGIRLMSFPKLNFGKVEKAEGSHGGTFMKMFFMNNRTSDKDLLREVSREMWDGVMKKEQKKLLVDLFKTLSPQEKAVTQFREDKSPAIPVKEWIAQVFATWFYRVEPAYLALTTNPKFSHLVELFESFLMK
jgi:hypothetical protein